MYTGFMGKRMMDDIDNQIVGAHALGGIGCMVIGCLHIPAIKAVAKTDMSSFWKFCGVACLASNALGCLNGGVKQFTKAIEYLNGPKVEDEETSDEAEEKPVTEESTNVVEFPSEEENK